MKLEELRQESIGKSSAFFDDEQAREQLSYAGFWLPVLLFGYTMLFGLMPLFLRYGVAAAKLPWYLSRIRKDPASRSFISIVLCILGGHLLVSIFVNILPVLRFFVHSDHSDPNAEIYLCSGFIFTYGLQEIIFVRFGNTDSYYVSQCYMCIVQFIRCELKLTPKILQQSDGEDHRVEADEGDDDPISVSDLDRLQEVLEISAEEASRLQKSVRASPNTPFQRPVSYWKKKRDDLRRRNPRMNLPVYLGVILLSLHSIPDGFFMGLQPDRDLSMYAFVSLLFHRCVIALLMGIELVAKNIKTTSIIFVITVFGLMAPIGSTLASLAVFTGAGSGKLALLLGVSGGSLLYVVVCELFKSDKSTYLLVPAESTGTLIGCAISLLLNWVARRKSHFWEIFM